VIPPTIAHYQLLSSLGAGGMGEVYLARDTRLDRLVAIKLLRAERTADATRLRRFEQESKAISALNHPNIVTIFEIGEASGARFIVLEYVNGQTIRALIGGRQGLEAIAPIGRQAARALAVAHGAGIVHRDIKPENIMVREDGYVKVLDFGLARLSATDSAADSMANTVMHTHAGTLIGTVAYMSPEQVQAAPVSGASDVFSLGVIFYEMATGRKPFAGGSEVTTMYQIVHGSPISASTLNSDVPPALANLILSMLQKQPHLRPSALDVAAALGAAADVAPMAIVPVDRGIGMSRETVGRSAERDRLRDAYYRAGQGRGLMLCVTGEAGLGKTTLVEDFLSELQRFSPAPMVGRGRSSERLAGSEAYLPFLEALESLIRATPSIVPTMKARAPSWYVQVATSADTSVERLMTEAPAVSQERMKRELVAFLQELATGNPLVLFFDDLHWSDASTVDIIAYLATKLPTMQLLIVVTYRLTEMRLRAHPFVALALDMKSRGICHDLPLNLLSREDVDRFLAIEFPHHQFPSAFAALIFAKTEGHPLFMADVVRYLRDKQVIGRMNGQWALVQTVPETETDLPETVRSMIQRKVAQLGDGDRRLLQAASAQGHAFDSAVVARALAMEPADVEERLQTLDRAYGLVTLEKEDELPDHTLTLRYRFVHVLHQNALYATLTPSRRASMSGAVADALVAFYGDDRGTIASELAFLYQAARDWARASDYFLAAARSAARIFANREAITLCERGLEMTQRMPEGPDRPRQELKLVMTLGPSLMTVRGFAASETLRAHLRARDLCERVGDRTQMFRVLFGLTIVTVVRAEYARARDFADQCLRQAELTDATALKVQAHWARGLVMQYTGEYVSAREQFERSIALYDHKQHAEHAFLYGAILNRMHLGRVLLYMGDAEAAAAMTTDGVDVAQKIRHPIGVCNALSVAVTQEVFYHRFDAIREMTDTMLRLADEHGFPYYGAIGRVLAGWAKAMQGAVDEGCAEMRAGMEMHRETETAHQRTYYLTLMAEALLAAGRIGPGLQVVKDAEDTIERTGERNYEADLHRVHGELLVAAGRVSEAESSIRRAIAVARAQGAKAFEGLATSSLERIPRR
jgi:predicted ATPase/tRNA A-37 threonylcarbamoyl transferase component Bud32